ncbi:allantoinase AllB [Marinactinospora thermotolerans]|uniref:allantoinase n=1 Tax=Marinactinospora thermotolerans DSM 45154 TaxID=1122192 RepID=A0A1T4LN72_9ACTN|nr:allantoinase AllB [Marinactinospora thermotolerans]SJZ56190.1 allantoinase [Marinactinospora thermotolerans DSM 45154]
MPEQAHDLVIRARRAITPEGERAIAVAVRDGRITAITDYDTPPAAARTVEVAADEVLLPGLVDSHVHVNDPGRSEWEGFATATRAAAAGGVTTIIDMPLNSIPPTTTVDGLEAKRAVARGNVLIDVGFWGGAVPENSGPATTKELRALHEQGVYGFKSFLSPSGVDEFGHLSPEEFRVAAEAIGEFGGVLIVHAEDPRVLDAAPPAYGRDYASFLASRPDEAEHAAIRLVIDTARATGTRCHILHLSSATALPMIRAAREEGVPLTVETCPHYLTIAAEEVPEGATQFKCCPPIRGSANRDQLWEALREGVIDCIVSDHSPSTVDLKNLDTGDFGTAWGGISGVQVGFSTVWTEASARGFPLAEVVEWMARRPAEIAGVDGKGGLVVGNDADFAVVAPDEVVRLDVAELHHRNPISAYDGRQVRGVVRATWLRGELVDPAEPKGRLLSRG